MECTGQPNPAAEALDMVRKNGRISFNGIYHDPVTLQLDKIVQWNLLITGPKAEGMLNLGRAIPLMADGRINLKPLITHTFPLEKINEAFEAAGANEIIYLPIPKGTSQILYLVNIPMAAAITLAFHAKTKIAPAP